MSMDRDESVTRIPSLMTPFLSFTDETSTPRKGVNSVSNAFSFKGQNQHKTLTRSFPQGQAIPSINVTFAGGEFTAKNQQVSKKRKCHFLHTGGQTLTDTRGQFLHGEPWRVAVPKAFRRSSADWLREWYDRLRSFVKRNLFAANGGSSFACPGIPGDVRWVPACWPLVGPTHTLGRYAVVRMLILRPAIAWTVEVGHNCWSKFKIEAKLLIFYFILFFNIWFWWRTQ